MTAKYETSPVAISLAALMIQPFEAFPVIAVSNENQLLEILKADEIRLEQEDIELLSKYL